MSSAQVDIQILEISKQSNNYNIRVRFREPSENVSFTTLSVIVEKTNMGDNLKSMISFLDLDKSGTLPESLPIIGWMKYAQRSVLQGSITVGRIDITTETLKAVVAHNWTEKDTVKKALPSQDYIVRYDYRPTLRDKDPYVKGVVDNVLDGDTVKIIVDEVKNLPNVQNGKALSVRFVGVLCPEVKKDVGDWYQRDEEWAAEHGLEPPTDENGVMDKILALSEEGKKYITNLVLGKRVMVIPEAGDPMDIYGRLTGMVYTDNAVGHVGTDDNELVVCVNTSIISNASKSFSPFALAEPTYKYSLDKNGLMKSKFDLPSWWKLVPNYEERLADIEKKQQQKENTAGMQGFLKKYGLHTVGNSSQTLDNKVEVVYNEEGEVYEGDKLINTNDIPADSQYEDYENMVVDDRNKLDKAMGIDPYNEFHLRIGDCTFLVPPLSIRLDSLTPNRRVQTLRSKSSIQTNTGYSSTLITVDLYFPNLESINGYKTKGPNGTWYYRNGLRPLIAQFKKAPFLPIENELINERFKIYSVAMQDLEVSTVPGFPGCVQARLTLLEFDHTTYMPAEEDFAATFCWPLYRWYYQRSMQPQEDPGRTYLKPQTKLDNSILFKMPDEGILSARRQAIYGLIDKISPQLFRDSNTQSDTTMGEMIREGQEIDSCQRQYSGFKRATKKYNTTTHPLLYNNQGVFDVSRLGVGDIPEGNRASYLDALLGIVSEAYYEGGPVQGTTKVYFVMNTIGYALDLIWALTKDIANKNLLDKIADILLPDDLFFVWQTGRDLIAYNKKYPESGWTAGILTQGLGGTPAQRNGVGSNIGWLVNDNVNEGLVFAQGGVFVIELKSNNATKLKTRILNTNYFTINPADAAAISMVQGTGNAMELSITDYELQFEEINFRAHMSEADIPEVDFPIDDIYIQSMTAQMHNTYAPLQLGSRESPTFQHLGSSDITMDLTIKTKNRESVEKFRQLMSEAQRLAREYRIAITSGVVSIDTAFMGLFGVRSILIERLSVETSGDDKESFIINISLVAFDKTQRMREDLDMVKAFGGTQEEAENAFYAYSKRRRNESGFEYAIVDLTLRDLEVYPDLELPTFEELNKDLPALKITYPNGAPFRVYPNPDHAKFVDPDFYVRCEHTFRDYIYAVLEDGNIPMYFKDRLGFESFDMTPSAEQSSGGGMTAPNTIYSEDTINWVNEHLAEVYTGESGASSGTAGWSSSTDFRNVERSKYNPKTTNDVEAVDVRKATVGGMAPAVAQSVKNSITKESLSKKPTDSEIKRWYNLGYGTPQSAVDQVRKDFRDPTSNEFRTYLEYIVADSTVGLFKNLPSDAELLKAGETDVDTYRYGKTRVSAPRITREKIVNVLKALYEQEHNWKQFNNDGSVCWSATNDVGIGQLNAYGSGILQTLDMARKAAWDWRFNLYKGVEYFAQCYNFCISYGHTYNPDAAVNPLDWAIVCYNRGPVTGLKNFAQPQEVDYYNGIMAKFKNKYGADALYSSANPNALYDPDVANQQVAPQIKLSKIKESVGLSKEQVAALKVYDFMDDTITSIKSFFTKKDEPEKTLVDDKGIASYYEYGKYCKVFHDVLVADQDHEIERYKDLAKTMTNPNWKKYFPITLSYALSEFVTGNKIDKNNQFVQVKSGAAQYLFDAYKGAFNDYLAGKLSKLKMMGWYGDHVDKAKLFQVLGAGDFSAAADVVNDIEIQQVIESVVVSPDDIGVLYRSCFSDMLEYDARGRLVRAFPTFQMFIVDEGRWMAWHKLWDNFYGYNSIVSVDLCRDRRIAADTAVIGMTNIYSNLSTYDNETSYGEWDYTLGDLIWGTGSLLGEGSKGKVWKTIWDLPDKDVLAARMDELNSMFLRPGARIHLRLGYGANAYRLPVVFNGTLTEMNTGELLTVVAQGDGIELCNKLRVSPGDTNIDGILKGVVEPRDFMGQMFTSKGSWLENMVNRVSGGAFYNSSPLGIVHFGISEIPTATLLKDLNIFNSFEDYGECAQNIYCSAGINTMSQWIYTEGSKKGESLGFKWNWTDLKSNGQGGDEPNIKISLFDQTPWSVMQTFAHSCPDYITTVLPFEFRSTVFYGKPWWGAIDRYRYKYFYDKGHDMFIREPYSVTRKALSQMRIYSDYFDIIKNDIKATEEFMYTNVVGIWDDGKKQTRAIQADSDIVPEKQKTAIINLANESNLWFTDKWTQSRYAEAAATSALRDYMKDMYQGEITVLGDPTVKPYDKMHIQDNKNDISGLAEVKRVVHHFSLDTGFISCITPDCISVIDDGQGISIATWVGSAAISTMAFATGMLAKNLVWKKMWSSPAAAAFRKWGRKASNKLFAQAIAKMANATPEEVKTLEAISDNLVDYVKSLVAPKGQMAKRSLNSSVIKKELNNILRKNKVYKAVDDKVLTRAANIMGSVVNTIKTKGGVAAAVDKAWDASKVLKTGKIMKNTGFVTSTINKVWSGTSKLAKFGAKTVGGSAAAIARGTGTLVARGAAAVGTGGASILVEIGIDIALTIVTATLVEEYGRWLKSRQALTIIPLKYRGSTFVAGIKGHKGLVAGEDASAWDKFLMGSGFGGGVVSGIYGFLGVDAPNYELSSDKATTKYMGN